MIKTRETVLTEKAEREYGNAVRAISETYEKITRAGRAISFSVEKILSDFDAYLQAALVCVCAGTGRFSRSETGFIENIARYGKLIEGTDLALFSDCPKETFASIYEKAEKRTKEIPLGIKMTAALDEGGNFGITKGIYVSIVGICFDLKLLDEKCDARENSDIAAVLKPLKDFAEGKGLSLN